MVSNDEFWSQWWTELAEQTDGLPPRVRNSAFNDITLASKEILETLKSRKNIFNEKKSIKILDIGAGSGLLTSHFIKDFKKEFNMECSATAIDLSPEYYKTRSQLFNAVCADVTALPFKSGLFDIVLCYSSLQYFQKKENLLVSLEEIFRVMNSSSCLLIFGFPEKNRKNAFINGYDKIGMKKIDIEEKKSLAEKRLWLSRSEMSDILNKTGFQKIEPANMNKDIWEHKYMFNISCCKQPQAVPSASSRVS
jgi:ubiquinone/menaquinone biosynthesis C-methylase UbiE